LPRKRGKGFKHDGRIVTCTDKICKKKERKKERRKEGRKEGRNSQLLLCPIYTFKEFVVGLGEERVKP